MAYGHKTPHQARQRATVVLLAARGRANARIATEVHVHVDTARTRRGRFAAGGLPALADRKRSGRPARFTSVQVAEAKSPACQLPAEAGTPLSRWSSRELADELTARDRSSPGSTGPGSSSATRTSAPRPSRYWTCTPAPSRASCSAPTSTSSPATRRPPSRPAAAATRPLTRARPGRCASVMSTAAAAPWPDAAWPPPDARFAAAGGPLVCQSEGGPPPATPPSCRRRAPGVTPSGRPVVRSQPGGQFRHGRSRGRGRGVVPAGQVGRDLGEGSRNRAYRRVQPG
ncbi:helix-turn-helix domain-containing protein [Streptomyces sp. NBC_01262]